MNSFPQPVKDALEVIRRHIVDSKSMDDLYGLEDELGDLADKADDKIAELPDD